MEIYIFLSYLKGVDFRHSFNRMIRFDDSINLDLTLF